MSIESTSTNQESAVGPEQWVERYGDVLYRFAKKRLRTASEAEEAVQETFLAAIGAQNQFTGSGTQLSWLRSILHNKIMDTMRQRERCSALESPDFVADPTDLLFDARGAWKPGLWPACPGQQVLEMQELWQIVKQCLAQIPPLQADVFVLSVMEEMDAESICRKLNITLSNMGVRLHRARLGLAKCVSAKWFQTEEASQADE
jgi:RNA polymerase sigma-70 factor (TIGR02943 family)